MTLYNEVDSATNLLDSILGGSVVPSEVVVSDGGSTDGTLEALEAYAEVHASVTLIGDAGGRSAGRNAAIAAATQSIIACIDGGCSPRSNWLERLIEPFDTGAEWVGGFYEPDGRSPLSAAIGLTMVYVKEEAEQHFVPSARSLAFRKDLWTEVEGFPEDVQFGEDTVFAEALSRAGHEMVFAPEAVVDWIPPSGLVSQGRTAFSWGRGDGLKGLRSDHYRRLLKAFSGSAAVLAGASLIDLKLAPLSVIPLIPVVKDHSRHKYRHMAGFMKWFLIPLATLNGFATSLAGFLAGRRIRKRTEVG